MTRATLGSVKEQLRQLEGRDLLDYLDLLCQAIAADAQHLSGSLGDDEQMPELTLYVAERLGHAMGQQAMAHNLASYGMAQLQAMVRSRLRHSVGLGVGAAFAEPTYDLYTTDETELAVLWRVIHRHGIGPSLDGGEPGWVPYAQRRYLEITDQICQVLGEPTCLEASQAHAADVGWDGSEPFAGQLLATEGQIGQAVAAIRQRDYPSE